MPHLKKFKIILTTELFADMINKYGIINGAKYFSLDGLQNYLVFQLFINYFSTENHNDNIELWTSKGISRESILQLHLQQKQVFIQK